jgi:hypothetical protein
VAPCGHTTAADVPDDCLVIGLDAQARDDLAVLLRTGRPLFDEVRDAVRHLADEPDVGRDEVIK